MISTKYIYVIVFSTLTGWALFAYVTTTQIIASQQEYSSVINTAGKQRMLSQKTALIATRYINEKDPLLITHLRFLIRKMREDHQHILQNNVISEKTVEIYHKEPRSLDTKVNHYLELLTQFLDDATVQRLEDIQAYSFKLLPLLDESVSVFERENDDKRQTLMDRELFILIGTLTTLLLEAIFIVIPSIVKSSRHEHELNKLISERTIKLQKLSITDELTQLYNRRQINNTLTAEIDKAKRYHGSFGVILFDIDLFKVVNDTYGHQTGDHVLQTIAELLRKNMRTVDVVGRWGGEEFMIITSEPEFDKLMHFAEKLRNAIQSYEFYTVGTITCSFGVTQYQEGDTSETIVSRADKALYKAKSSGRNCVKAIHSS